MLTATHPWGFTADDKADFLGVAAIREALKKYGSETRPDVTAAWPSVGRAPIPFSWLINVVFGDDGSGDGLWAKILSRCKEWAGRAWADHAAVLIAAHLGQSAPSNHLTRIESALQNAKRYSLVALKVPQEVLKERSLQEEAGEASGPESDNRIYNVEHLFQRLNSAGTELRGEELQFSMIKAYWPSIEQSFDAIRANKADATCQCPALDSRC